MFFWTNGLFWGSHGPYIIQLENPFDLSCHKTCWTMKHYSKAKHVGFHVIRSSIFPWSIFFFRASVKRTWTGPNFSPIANSPNWKVNAAYNFLKFVSTDSPAIGTFKRGCFKRVESSWESGIIPVQEAGGHKWGLQVNTVILYHVCHPPTHCPAQ